MRRKFTQKDSVTWIKQQEIKDNAVLGHPKIKLSRIKDWDERMISLFREGASIKEVRAALDISQVVWDRFMEEEPRFREIAVHGKDLAEAWWESEGRKNLQNTRFSAVLWYMNMKNRFGWTDKQSVDYTSQGKAITPNILIFGPTDPLSKRLKENERSNIPLQLGSGETSA